jgi:uridine phosphorylase
MKSTIAETELMLNKDGSVYHLALHPEDMAETVIHVGDPDRVSMISDYFETIEVKKQKREFVTHTGTYKGKRITALSTGISTDNIDIVYNELDALVNIDLKTRKIKDNLKSLQMVRIGTSGALQADIPLNSFLFSQFSIGLEGLMNFYKLENDLGESDIKHAFNQHYPTDGVMPPPYIARCSSLLEEKISPGMLKGITCSCAGFYGPQGRVLRYDLAQPDMITSLNSFQYQEHRITNLEMETAGMYGLAKVLGHDCCAVNVIVANRMTHEFSHQADEAMSHLIQTVLDRV